MHSLCTTWHEYSVEFETKKNDYIWIMGPEVLRSCIKCMRFIEYCYTFYIKRTVFLNTLEWLYYNYGISYKEFHLKYYLKYHQGTFVFIRVRIIVYYIHS